VFLLCLLSGLFNAIVTAFDNGIVRFIGKSAPESVKVDSLTTALVYLSLGGTVGVATQFVTSNFFGKRISADFTGIKLFTGQAQKAACFSGFLSAAAMMFYLWGSQLADPSVTTVLSNVTVVYLLGYDALTKHVKLRWLWLPALLILGGAVLTAWNNEARFDATMLGLGVLLIGRGVPLALSQVVNQGGVRQASDPVNYAFQRFYWLAIWGVILGFFVSVSRGALGAWLGLLRAAFWPALPWIVALMFFVTFANAFEMAARKQSQASIVSLLLVVQVVFVFVITVAGDWLWSGIFGALPDSHLVWFGRFAGAGVVTAGAFLVRHYQARATGT